LKINWYSPLRPAQSGIADNYAMQVLPALARRAELVLWTDQDQVSPEMRRLARVARYDPATPPWREINDGTISIYHLGNDPGFHAGIYRISACQPGIVVLHDLYLHDFFSLPMIRSVEDRAGYLAALERWYGEEGRQAGEAYCAGGISAESMAQRFPLTREAGHGALGVIVHSSQALEELRGMPCPVALLDHPYLPMESSRYQRCLAVRVSNPGPPYRLLVFGYLGRNRRLEALLEAWAGLAERHQFRLDVCGQLWDESYVRTQIERLGLTPLVNLHGFLTAAEVEHRLTTAHLAINLRYPSMGEASGSQLQFWDYGLPTLVTETSWYATLPPDAVAFVRPEHEVDDIQAHFRAFLADPGKFRAMGERGRQSLKNHDPEKYVNAMVRFIAEALRHAPQVVALSLANRVGIDLSSWLHPLVAHYMLDRASKEIARIVENAK
jgi:glycosyltransferase involved in cell wall biosynthesis